MISNGIHHQNHQQTRPPVIVSSNTPSSIVDRPSTRLGEYSDSATIESESIDRSSSSGGANNNNNGQIVSHPLDAYRDAFTALEEDDGSDYLPSGFETAVSERPSQMSNQPNNNRYAFTNEATKYEDSVSLNDAVTNPDATTTAQTANTANMKSETDSILSEFLTNLRFDETSANNNNTTTTNNKQSLQKKPSFATGNSNALL